MKIHVKVNQAQCIRIGVDAPQSTVDIEVDPVTLTQAQRDWIAARIEQGYRLDAVGAIAPPTLAGLLAVVDAKAAIEAEEAAKREARHAAELAADIEAVRAMLASPPARERVYVGFDPLTGARSTATGHAGGYVETVQVDPFPGPLTLRNFPADLVAAIEAEKARRAEIRERDIEDALPGMYDAHSAELTAANERARHLKDTRVNILRRGERVELIERIYAGVAPAAEVEQAIRDIVASELVRALRIGRYEVLPEMGLGSAYVVDDTDWETERDCKELTAEQWAFVKRVRAAIDASGCLQDVEWDYSTMTSPDGVEFFALCLYRDVAGMKCVVRLAEVDERRASEDEDDQ